MNNEWISVLIWFRETKQNVVVIEPAVVGAGRGLQHDGEAAEDGQRTSHVRNLNYIRQHVLVWALMCNGKGNA